jgi:hypothetical protein
MLCIDIPISVRPISAYYLVVKVVIEIESAKATIHCNHVKSSNVMWP